MLEFSTNHKVDQPKKISFKKYSFWSRTTGVMVKNMTPAWCWVHALMLLFFLRGFSCKYRFSNKKKHRKKYRTWRFLTFLTCKKILNILHHSLAQVITIGVIFEMPPRTNGAKFKYFQHLLISIMHDWVLMINYRNGHLVLQ